MGTRCEALRELGQSLCLDYIRRSFITSGEFRELVEAGLGGVTSSPSIFEKAIACSSDYDDQFHRLAEAGYSENELYENLIVQDIQMAADELLEEGVAGFARSFKSLKETIREKRQKLLAGWLHLEPSPHLGARSHGMET